MDYKIILRACEGRESFKYYLIERIPGLIVVNDTDKNAMHTFLTAMQTSGDSACVHIEDDILITKDFVNKLDIAIQKMPQTVIQFFSMRKDDIEIGSRFDTGSKFMMCQCFYFPPEHSKKLFEFHSVWEKREQQPRSGYDLLIADFLKSRKERYYIHVPNLVNHRITRSVINKSRSMFRQSKTFVE